MDMSISNVANSKSAFGPPTLRVSCTQRNLWKSLWGPEITCTSDPSNTQFFNIGITNDFVPSRTVGPLNDYFKCNILSKHIFNYSVDYTCEQQAYTSAVNSLTVTKNCIYNTSIWLNNVYSPVAELDLVLPSSRQGIGTASIQCDRQHQVLNCPELTLNSSFYESLFETYLWADPIQCFLSYSLSGRDGRNTDETSTTLDMESSTYPFFDMASAIVVASNDVSSELPYEWAFLCVLVFIAAGAVGNLLVCFAVLLDRKLQNVTNYFLFSLAIADLLVSLVVMPLGAIPSFMGE